ncbi:MAG: hypothetical protein PHO67_07790 [Candidatus Omnitrophica bacterium]|nr:hypothetical protein [Candidatus Omnitrophota bacterium]
MPVEHFLIDPVTPIDLQAFRTPRIIEKAGVNHVLIWIGKEFYPSVPAYIDEARIQGISRRIPRSFPIERLTTESRMMMVHACARVAESGHYGSYIGICEGNTIDWYCPKGDMLHRRPGAVDSDTPQCIGMLWPLSKEFVDMRYEPQYATGIFASFPITNIDYVVDPERPGVPRDIADRAGRTDLPLNPVEE